MRVFAIDGIAGYHGNLDDTSTAIGFPAAGLVKNSVQARAALISVKVAGINFTLEGTVPTVTADTDIGHNLPVGGSYEIVGESNVASFQAINAVAASGATVEYTLFY
jgi:hypothetical protein